MKVNKLKRLKCLKVKVGMERDSDAVHPSQDINKNASVDDNHRQIHLSVINSSSMNMHGVCDERTDTASTSSFHNHVNDSPQVLPPRTNNYTSINDQIRRDSYNRKVGDNNSSRNSSLVNGDSLLPVVQIAPDGNGLVHVPGRVPETGEQISNVYRTSTESQGSLSMVLQHSSHQQLVDIENAKEACVSMAWCRVFIKNLSSRRMFWE